jgi:hypothetical protein
MGANDELSLTYSLSNKIRQSTSARFIFEDLLSSYHQKCVNIIDKTVIDFFYLYLRREFQFSILKRKSKHAIGLNFLIVI